MRVVFLGTGDISLPCLKMLIDSEWIDLCGVVTQPDKPFGRKQVMTPPEVKIMAQNAGIEVFQPENVSSPAAVEKISRWEPEIIVVMAYGQILKQVLLDVPSLACINVHASLLPKYRGASCIQEAIANGDKETGVTIMHVVKKLDAGDMIFKKVSPLSSEDTGGIVHDRLAEESPEALEQAMKALADGSARREVQDDALSTYAPKLLRQDGELDWSESAGSLERLIRAYDPWPGTFTVYQDGKGKQRRLKIFPPVEVRSESGEAGVLLPPVEGEDLIACGEGAIALSKVQPEGKQVMLFGDFLRGVENVKFGA